MPSPVTQFPRALVERSLTTGVSPTDEDRARASREWGVEIGERIPVLLAHPDPGWHEAGAEPTPAPVCVWFHGRTVSKELDPGRYLRWVRGGIAACAVDLPGHGERAREGWDSSDMTLSVVERAAAEVDAVVRALGDARFNGAFDVSRVAVGGMSAGGMTTLLRVTRSHGFRCAAVESTMGDFEELARRGQYDAGRARALSPMHRLESWRPIPLLALHSEKDEWVPVGAIRALLGALSERYSAVGADPGLLTLRTWAETGAPYEHAGFGRVSNEAKNLQLEFLERWLLADGAGAGAG
ncbi:MAG: alpha/beta hydrolase family protein [Phycisphaerales bacterium]